MKTLIVILAAVYLIISVLGCLIGLAFNGKFDKSKEPIGKIVKRSFSWPIDLLKRR